MTDSKRFISVWDALENSPEESASMKACSALRMAQAPTNPVDAAAYIEATVELDGPAALLVALRKVVEAHGLAEIALRTGIDENTLSLDLSENGIATLNTVQKVLHAVGLRLNVARIEPQHA